MKGKVCVITGATSGIGRATALALSALGAELVLLGRNKKAGEGLVRRLATQSGSEGILFLPADLSTQNDVRIAAGKINARHDRIDVLINNAGARYDCYVPSADGHEMTFAANHLGHFLLTGLLLGKLLRSADGRIISIASGSHGSARADGIWELTETSYDRKQAYAKSKLANVVFARELGRRLNGTAVVSLALDPGGVASRFARNNGIIAWIRHLLAHLKQRDLISPAVAAQYVVRLAREPELANANGAYFLRSALARPLPASQDESLAKSLWEISVKHTGIATEVDVPELMVHV